MKRATLTAYATNLPPQPADLTDRLLAQESRLAAPPKKRRAGQTRARQAKPKATQSDISPESLVTAAAQRTSLEEALAAADASVAALRQAGRDAPARYDVALHYRLDALAHHLQQVKEFIASLASR